MARGRRYWRASNKRVFDSYKLFLYRLSAVGALWQNIEHFSRYPKVKGSSPVTTAGTRREKIVRKTNYYLIFRKYFSADSQRWQYTLVSSFQSQGFQSRGRIFSCGPPSYELAVNNLDRSMHISLWVQVTHSSFIEGLHTTKNTASGPTADNRKEKSPKMAISFMKIYE